MPGRKGNTPDYRYGFQGQEMDNEIKGEGNSINYKYRMHDPRVGRFFAVDPLSPEYPHYSPYSFGGNKVIRFVELEGLEEKNPSTFTKATNAIFGMFHINRMNAYITENDIPEDNILILANDTFVVIKVLEDNEAKYSIFRMSRKTKNFSFPYLLTSEKNDDIELTAKEFNDVEVLGEKVLPAPGVGGGGKVVNGLRLAGSGNNVLKFGQVVGFVKNAKKSLQLWRKEMEVGKLIATSGSKDLLKKGLHFHFKKLGGLELGLTVKDGVLSLKWLNVGKAGDVKKAVETFNKSMKNPTFKATLNATLKSASETLDDAIKFLKGSDLENAKKVLDEVKEISKALNK